MTCATTWLLSEICVFINYARRCLRVGLGSAFGMINSPRLIRRLAKWRGKHSKVNDYEILRPYLIMLLVLTRLIGNEIIKGASTRHKPKRKLIIHLNPISYLRFLTLLKNKTISYLIVFKFFSFLFLFICFFFCGIFCLAFFNLIFSLS